MEQQIAKEYKQQTKKKNNKTTRKNHLIIITLQLRRKGNIINSS